MSTAHRPWPMDAGLASRTGLWTAPETAACAFHGGRPQGGVWHGRRVRAQGSAGPCRPLRGRAAGAGVMAAGYGWRAAPSRAPRAARRHLETRDPAPGGGAPRRTPWPVTFPGGSRCRHAPCRGGRGHANTRFGSSPRIRIAGLVGTGPSGAPRRTARPAPRRTAGALPASPRRWPPKSPDFKPKLLICPTTKGRQFV